MSWLRGYSCRPFGTNVAGLFPVPWADAHGDSMSPLRGWRAVVYAASVQAARPGVST